MYTNYFNFKEPPFSIAPNPRFLYMSPRHQEGLAHLLYGIKKGEGFVTLTGEVGTGKTTLCHCFLEQLPDDIEIALILNPKLNSIELLASICDELGIHYPPGNQSLKTFIDLLNKYLLSAHAKGRRTVLVIDEAQNLSFEVLEQIRLLTNLETSTTKLLQIILVGQPELKQLLNRQELRQLNQRITARYHLQPLSFAETRAYIHHRLSVSGGRQDIFTDRAIRKIFKLAKGIPRSINILCDRSLLGAYASGEHTIKSKIIKKAANEALPEIEKTNHPIRLAIFVILIFISLGAGFYFFIYPMRTDINELRLSSLLNKLQLSISSPVTSANDTELPGSVSIANKQPAVAITNKSEHNPEPAKHQMVGPIRPGYVIVSDAKETAIDMPVDENTAIEETQTFREIITNSGLDLNSALTQLLNIWSEKAPPGQPVDCDLILKRGLHCLFDIDSWNHVITLNRPTVLEFALPGKIKRYALLIGTEQGQPILRINDDYVVRLDEVLSYWQGYFLTLWKPPFPGMQYTYPRQTSKNVMWLRQQMDAIEENSETVTRPRYYDKNLKKRVISFQRQNNLKEDGIVGPRTIIHLQNSAVMINFPLLEITD